MQALVIEKGLTNNDKKVDHIYFRKINLSKKLSSLSLYKIDTDQLYQANIESAVECWSHYYIYFDKELFNEMHTNHNYDEKMLPLVINHINGFNVNGLHKWKDGITANILVVEG